MVPLAMAVGLLETAHQYRQYLAAYMQLPEMGRQARKYMPLNTINLVVGHGPCLDGDATIASAFVAQARGEINSNVEFVSYNHIKPQDFDHTKYKNINIVFTDCAPTPAQYDAMVAAGCKILVLDHHKSAIQKLGNREGVFTTMLSLASSLSIRLFKAYNEFVRIGNKIFGDGWFKPITPISGVPIAWEYFNHGIPLPDLFDLIAKNDLKLFLPGVRESAAALRNEFPRLEPKDLIPFINWETATDIQRAVLVELKYKLDQAAAYKTAAATKKPPVEPVKLLPTYAFDKTALAELIIRGEPIVALQNKAIAHFAPNAVIGTLYTQDRKEQVAATVYEITDFVDRENPNTVLPAYSLVTPMGEHVCLEPEHSQNLVVFSYAATDRSGKLTEDTTWSLRVGDDNSFDAGVFAGKYIYTDDKGKQTPGGGHPKAATILMKGTASPVQSGLFYPGLIPQSRTWLPSRVEIKNVVAENPVRTAATVGLAAVGGAYLAFPAARL